MLTKLLYSLIKASHYWAIYYLYYKKKLKMTKSAYISLLVWLPAKLLSLPSNWSNNIVKFGTYYLHYNDKVITNPIQTLNLYFLSNFGNFLTIFPILASNSRAYNIELGLITKKGKLPRIFLSFFLGAL